MRLTGTIEDLESLVVDEFVFGAPFRCTYFENAEWNEESQSVLGSKNGVVVSSGATTRLQSVGYDEELGVHYVYHIDVFPFSTKTIGEYLTEYPDDESIRDRVCDLVEGEYIIKEGLSEKTPQEYVKEKIYTKYNLTEV